MFSAHNLEPDIPHIEVPAGGWDGGGGDGDVRIKPVMIGKCPMFVLHGEPGRDREILTVTAMVHEKVNGSWFRHHLDLDTEYTLRLFTPSSNEFHVASLGWNGTWLKASHSVLYEVYPPSGGYAPSDAHRQMPDEARSDLWRDMFTSRDIAESLNVSVQLVNRIARDWEIGTIIGNTRVFTQSEFRRIQSRRTVRGPVPRPGEPGNVI